MPGKLYFSNGTGWLLDQIPIEEPDRAEVLWAIVMALGGLEEAAAALKAGELVLEARVRIGLFNRGMAPKEGE